VAFLSMAPEDRPVTKLLQQWSAGSKEALDQLMPLVYDQLRKLASRCLVAERPGHRLWGAMQSLSSISSRTVFRCGRLRECP
jgi:ECF sigma factor